jgi:CBS domain-containing protein
MQPTIDSLMTKEPACSTTDKTLRDVAQMMVVNDCGAIPVVESKESMKLVGIITDRDIVCRGIASGKDPARTMVAECMSQPVVSASPDLPLDRCLLLMEDNQIRRVPVVDAEGRCVGLVTQAHIAQHADHHEVARLARDVSRKTSAPSNVKSIRGHAA